MRRYFFQGILVLLAILMTAYLVNFRVISSGWAKDDVIYPQVEQKLIESGIRPAGCCDRSQSTGIFHRFGSPSISLPFGDESTILAVAEKFGARYLVLEKDGTFDSIQDLYDHPEDNPSFTYLGEVDSARLYRIETDN